MFDPPYIPICPDCLSGKHTICDGTAWDRINDELTSCMCDQGACAPGHPAQR